METDLTSSDEDEDDPDVYTFLEEKGVKIGEATLREHLEVIPFFNHGLYVANAEYALESLNDSDEHELDMRPYFVEAEDRPSCLLYHLRKTPTGERRFRLLPDCPYELEEEFGDGDFATLYPIPEYMESEEGRYGE